MPLTFSEYQLKAEQTAIYPDNVRITYPAMGLGGEAGEVLNKVKKIFRDDNGFVTDEKRKEIKKEIGGVLWYLAALAKDLNIELEDAAQENLDILASRAQRGVLKGSGDNR